jgi:hypothetical protein
MTPQPTPPGPAEPLHPAAAALAEHIAEVVYLRLRGDVVMGDDMLLTEQEVAEIMHRNPAAAAAQRRIGVGPQGVRIAGSRRLLFRVGAVRRYLDEVKAGAASLVPFLQAAERVGRGQAT